MSEWNLSDPECRSQAAADYVLGLLDQTEQMQFEALLKVSHEAQAEVLHWQEQLNILNEKLKPERPPKRVWQKIHAATRPESFWSSLRFWQGAGVSMMSVLVLSALLWWQGPINSGAMDYVYVVQGKNAQPEWIVNASLDEDMLYVKAVQPDELPAGQVCELWLMVQNREPVSLGILPKSGVNRVPIQPEWRKQLRDSPLVISLEKSMRGAPSGYDMGPVVNKGQWTSINKSI